MTLLQPLRGALGRVIQRRRREMGHTWRTLGKRCGVSHNTIRNLERGDRSTRLDIIERIAWALGLPLSRLIREAERRTR
jgi:transcriptional regulator with XRE-family HTH domain